MLLVTSVVQYLFVFFNSCTVVQANKLWENGVCKSVFFNTRKWILSEVWFEYYFDFYLPQFLKCIKEETKPVAKALFSPMHVQMDKRWFTYIRLRESHYSLILLLHKVHKFDTCQVEKSIDDCMTSLCNKFVNWGVNHSQNIDEKINEIKIRNNIMRKLNYIQCRVLTWVHIERSKVAARFHVHRGDFVFGLSVKDIRRLFALIV